VTAASFRVTANGELAAILVAVLAVLGMVMRPGISDWTYATKKRSRRINGRLSLQMFLRDAWNTCGITRA
jgi:hypothetical protein